jgi:hypothetical protein
VGEGVRAVGRVEVAERRSRLAGAETRVSVESATTSVEGKS